MSYHFGNDLIEIADFYQIAAETVAAPKMFLGVSPKRRYIIMGGPLSPQVLDAIHRAERGHPQSRAETAIELCLTHSAVMLPLNMVALAYTNEVYEIKGGKPQNFFPQCPQWAQWLQATIKAKPARPASTPGSKIRIIEVKGQVFMPFWGVADLKGRCKLRFQKGQWTPLSVDITYQEDTSKTVRYICKSSLSTMMNLQKVE